MNFKLCLVGALPCAKSGTSPMGLGRLFKTACFFLLGGIFFACDSRTYLENPKLDKTELLSTVVLISPEATQQIAYISKLVSVLQELDTTLITTANVGLKEESGDTYTPFSYDTEVQYYTLPKDQLAIVDGKSYTLNVTYGDKEVTAKTQVLQQPLGVEVVDLKLAGPEGTWTLNVDVADRIEEGNGYRLGVYAILSHQDYLLQRYPPSLSEAKKKELLDTHQRVLAQEGKSLKDLVRIELGLADIVSDEGYEGQKIRLNVWLSGIGQVLELLKTGALEIYPLEISVITFDTDLKKYLQSLEGFTGPFTEPSLIPLFDEGNVGVFGSYRIFTINIADIRTLLK